MVLATSSLGAIWTSSPPEFGLTAILERFTQVGLIRAMQPRVHSADYVLP